MRNETQVDTMRAGPAITQKQSEPGQTITGRQMTQGLQNKTQNKTETPGHDRSGGGEGAKNATAFGNSQMRIVRNCPPSFDRNL